MPSFGRIQPTAQFGRGGITPTIVYAPSIQGPQGIPGEKGEKGDTGVGVQSADINPTGELVLGLTDSSVLNAGSVLAPTEVWTKDDIIPTSIGGITAGTVGQTLDGLTPMQILEKLLYPYQALSVLSFGVGLPISTTVEVGTTCAAGTYAASWAFNNSSNLTANSILISQGSTTLASGLNISPFSITHPQYQYDTPTQLPFTISAGQKEGSNVTSTINYAWKKKIWYGKSNLTGLSSYSNFSSFSSIFTQGLTSVNSANYSFSATTGDDQYLYIIIPDTGAYSTFTESGFDYPFETAQTVTFTNALGVSLSYKYYRSTNATESSVIINAGV